MGGRVEDDATASDTAAEYMGSEIISETGIFHHVPCQS
jgi:hypothetical protein